jgi:hypothetical protein
MRPLCILRVVSGVSRVLLVGLPVLCLSACSVASPTSAAVNGLPGDLSFCQAEVNRYRAAIGRPPLARSEALEEFAATAAAADATARIAHFHFAATNGGGKAKAETEILWWRGGRVRSVIEQGLAQMWQAGPGGEHYQILAGPYTEIGCGVFAEAGEVTVVQDFR